MKIANDNDIDYNAPTYFMHSPLFQVFPSSKQSKDYLFDSARSNGTFLQHLITQKETQVHLKWIISSRWSCAQKS